MPSYKVLQHFFTVTLLVNIIISYGFVRADAEAESRQVSDLTYALSFYVTKTVLVGPKWFWSDQIDLDLTIMIWS